jgi:hypothetical protein
LPQALARAFLSRPITLSHPDLTEELPHGVRYIFRTRGIESLSKTPGSKPRGPFHELGFLASYVLEGYECQSPGTRQKSPGSRHLPEENTSYCTYILFSFRPPSTSLFRSRVSMETRPLRADKELSHQQSLSMPESTRATSRGDVCEGNGLVSTPATHLTLITLDKHKAFQPLHATPACRIKALHGV